PSFTFAAYLLRGRDNPPVEDTPRHHLDRCLIGQANRDPPAFPLPEAGGSHFPAEAGRSRLQAMAELMRNIWIKSAIAGRNHASAGATRRARPARPRRA